MDSLSESLTSLEAQLSRLEDPVEKVAAIRSHILQTTPKTPTVGWLHASQLTVPTPASNDCDTLQKGIDRLLIQHDLKEIYITYMVEMAQKDILLYDLSLDTLRCSNIDPPRSICPREGSMRCAACKLTSYCSKECQKDHWKTHRRDCKNPLRALDWKPSWIRERRTPDFVGGGSRYTSTLGPMMRNMSLWGNMPAIDLLNLSHNEKDASDDLTIAFIGSGDLRDVVRTVNEVPMTYAGELTIVLNDHNPMIVARNLALLILLSSTENKRKAADLAVHYWYSAFVPEMYNAEMKLAVTNVLTSFDDDCSLSHSLSTKSRLEGCPGKAVMSTLAQCLISERSYGMTDAQNELVRSRVINANEDRLHRSYWQLEPSHRLAFHEFRGFGLLLPFGAANSDFNHPNRLLFSPQGNWLQSDKQNPLNGWHLPSVVEGGKKHNALPMDIYGCLYFYVSDQLREFATRLSNLRITFKLFNLDACQLAKDICSGALSRHELSPDIQIDRIDTSNLMDPHYLDIAPVLNAWGPLLRQNSHATLIGHFINWAARQEGADPPDHDQPLLIRRLMADKRIPGMPPGSSPRVAKEFAERASICAEMAYSAVYDNSRAFEQYLNSRDLSSILRTSGLKVKHSHTVVPHRLRGSYESASALPDFPDDQSWYLNVVVNDHLWSERYLELTRA
ncbi:uncharacterized protein FIBRA_00305 [Fibroporia radiculosa]|uniref:MYND-type domain-containing protein n=1 Tax=Fibroporia radiculosa TaxID=599839 RepID=J7SC06_9APHY|nr:uncharacterized protein FIBRA_00305 [Fibroporia radiculosa]CCL98311.1 predicted protein [Fibroporia radiculosa]